MAQEDHSQRYSNNSCGGAGGGGGSGGAGGGGGYNRCSKKLKQKKVPQRGLGVAQLEKIRLEEQQRKDVSNSSISSPNSIISPSNSSNCLAFKPTISSPSIPLPPPSPNNLPSIPNIDVLNPSPVSLSKAMNGGGGGGDEIGWLTGGRGGSWPKLWNGEYNNLQGENHGGLDHRSGGLAFTTNVRLPYESNTPTWPLPNVVHQRSQQFQQPCSSSMMKVSTGTSSSSSISVLNFQMEPPSNQSYCGNNYTPPFWPEEEKMVGVKRSYPFSLDNVPIPSFHCKFPSSYVSPISRSDESASCSNGGTTSVEPPNPVFREGPSSSSAISEPSPKKVLEENGVLNGDFLTLAPPETVQLQLSAKQKQQPSTKLSLQCQELSQFAETLPLQGTKNNPIHVSGQGGSSNQQTFLSFFPSAKTHTGQSVGCRGNSNGSTGESVDLNLRL